MTKLTEVLTSQLVDQGSRRLFRDDELDQWFTGDQFGQDVKQIASFLMTAKVQRGDQILVCLDNSVAYLTIMQAAWELGIVVHPIAFTTPIEQLKAELVEQDYACLIMKDSFVSSLEQMNNFIKDNLELNTMVKMNLFVSTKMLSRKHLVVVTPHEDDLAMILNTSGTTGKPKRVGLTHRLLNNAAIHDYLSHELTKLDTTMVIMPMFHINAQVMSCLSMRYAGGRIMTTSKFSASKFWNQVTDNQVTWVSVVPTIVSILLMNEKAKVVYEERQDKVALRFLRSSSFSLPEHQLLSFEKQFNTQILEGYGMTETTSQSTINPFNAPKIGSAGKPFGTELAINVNGQLQKNATEIGEIWLRGDHVINDYLESQPDSFEDGWFKTGDLGYVDGDGYLFVKGRQKEMINRGGEKVAPAKVESILTRLEAVKEVAVIGLPDDLYGEQVTAVIVSSSEIDEKTLSNQVIAYAKENLATFECPTQVFRINEFPKNNTGKILRPKLAEMLVMQHV